MSKTDEKQTKIYSLSSLTGDVKYTFIGSTKDVNKRRFVYKNRVLGDEKGALYECIRTNGGWDNWELKQIDSFVCKTRDEAKEKEKEWIEKIQNLENPPICLNLPQFSLKNTSIFTQKPSILPQKWSKIDENQNVCIFCSKIYSRKDNLQRHIKNCKKKNANTQLTQQDASVLNSNNTNTINSHNNNSTNNTAIITNNNNIVYRVGFGNESISERLSDKQKTDILRKMHTCLLHYIDKIHFSGEFPEFMNISYTNLRSKHALVYSEQQKQFVATLANELFTEVINTRLDEIHDMYEEHKDKLNTKTDERLNNFFSDISDKPEKYQTALENVKMLAYNNRNKVDTGNMVVKP